MFNRQNDRKNEMMLTGSFAKKGYDWWWHSFTAINEKTKEEKPFYIEFFLMNPKLNPDQVILGQSQKAKAQGLKPTYLMVNVGTWGENHKQLHRFFPLKEVRIVRCPIEIEAGDCFLSESETRGSVLIHEHQDGDMSDLGEISWDLKIHKKIAWNVGYGTSRLFCNIKAFEMYWHAQGMKTLYEGKIVLDGETYLVQEDTSYGYADKNWGSNFTTPWVWLSSSHLYDNIHHQYLTNSVFDIGGGKPRVFGISLPRKLLAAYYIEGKEYEMNFSKFLTHPCRTRFSFDESDPEKVKWEVVQSDARYEITTRVSSKKKEMLFINYETPEGLKPFSRLYNGGNGQGTLIIKNKKTGEIIQDLSFYNAGCEYGEFDPDYRK